MLSMTHEEFDEFMAANGAEYRMLTKQAGGSWQVLLVLADGRRTAIYGTNKPDLIRHMVDTVKGSTVETGTGVIEGNRVARLGLTYAISKLLPREEEPL